LLVGWFVGFVVGEELDFAIHEFSVGLVDGVLSSDSTEFCFGHAVERPFDSQAVLGHGLRLLDSDQELLVARRDETKESPRWENRWREASDLDLGFGIRSSSIDAVLGMFLEEFSDEQSKILRIHSSPIVVRFVGLVVG
jgi:hypothetical protein